MEDKKTEKSDTNYRKLLIIPIILLIFSLGYLYVATTGPGLERDIDLKGGTQISIEFESSINGDSIKSILAEFEPKIKTGRSINGFTVIIEVESSVNTSEVMQKLENSGYSFENYSVQTMGPILGESFFKQSQYALAFAFVFMAIVIFIIFRKLLPSFYVVLCASADIIETLAFSQILGIKLSLASFSALLLLVGYSVDTDILLTTRLLKAGGDVKENMKNALKTGLTMSATTLTVLLSLYFISTSGIIQQIASVLIIGLVLDITNTWLLNAPLIRWYIEKKVNK